VAADQAPTWPPRPVVAAHFGESADGLLAAWLFRPRGAACGAGLDEIEAAVTNVAGRPGLDHPAAFWWVMLAMAALPAAFLPALRWRGRL
jgi:hypothetical protein